MQVLRFELLEWHDRRYQRVRLLKGTSEEAKEVAKRLNKGYTGPRFVIREVQA